MSITLFFVKSTFSEKATKIDKIFTVNLTVCINHQIDGEDFVNFCGLLKGRFFSENLMGLKKNMPNHYLRLEFLKLHYVAKNEQKFKQ